MTLFLVAFVAGILTVLSPCVLPVLPVVVGGSLAGGKSIRRALTVTISLGVSVFIFTLLLKVSTAFISVPQSAWNWLSGTILFSVGIFYLFPNLWDLIPGTAKVSRDSNKLMSSGFMKQSFWGDVVVGAALGPVFSSCSPTYFIVLATVLPASLSMGIADIFAYVLGLCLFLFIISVAGQKLLARLDIAASPNSSVRKVIGVLFLVIAILITTGTLAKVEAPLYSIFDATKLEQHLIPSRSPSAISTTTQAVAPVLRPEAKLTGATAGTSEKTVPILTLSQKAARFTKASELVSPDGYLNTGGEKISLASLKGKVVLLDFWTYSCINCERTLPYLNAWYEKYKDQGLVILGVHTPEFAFEHLQSNVEAALKQFGVQYPVVLDNEYKTWNAYQNQYWPHEFLIDMDGYIVHDHIGEGGYVDTETAIQAALAERMARMNRAEAVATSTVNITPADLSSVGSPETYFGSGRNEYLGNGTARASGEQTLTIPQDPKGNTLYLGGTWNFVREYATNTTKGAHILYTYKAQHVYLVASGIPGGSRVTVLQDGKPIGNAAGADVVGGVLTVGASKLYEVVSNPDAHVHTLELIVESPGLAAYAFTFG